MGGSDPAIAEFEFQPLNRLTEEAADRIIALGVDKIFTGVPTTLLEPPVDPDAAADPPPEDAPPAPPSLTEADRLAQVVQEIDFDTAVVPKGAYALNEAHAVVPSGDFKGLGITEATCIKKYVHFRPPTSVASLRALARTDMEFFADFLDPLDG